MAVEIGEEKVQEVKNDQDPDKGAKGYQIVSKICNDGDSAVTVIVTQWPYSATVPKMKKIGEKKEREYTIPAGQCIDVCFGTYPVGEKPVMTYTDVFEKKPEGGKGGILDGESNDLTGSQIKRSATDQGSVLYFPIFPAPFPQRLVDAHGENWVGEFVIESVTGAPPGWSVAVIEPSGGGPFTVSPNNRENAGILRVVTGPEVLEGTNVKLNIVQRVVGAPDETVNRFDTNVWLVADSTPPVVDLDERVPNPVERTLLVRAHATDDISGVSAYTVRYSTDDGENWTETFLGAPKDTSAELDPDFSTVLGPFCAGQTVKTVVTAIDGVGNVRTQPVQSNTF